MSEEVKRIFRDWMIAKGKALNTASNYISGINTVSKHYRHDVFEITDLDKLESLQLIYGPKGEFADIGASNSNNVQSGLRQWLEYQKELSKNNRSDVDVNGTNPAQISPLNQILYGPPGTGKTYETIYAALKILDPAAAVAYKQVDRDKTASLAQRLAARKELKKHFDELSAEQRVRFITFHQSFSYEDFVEGLRAETVNGQVQYPVADGVFKQICDDASATRESVNLNALLDAFIEKVAEEPLMLQTTTGKQFLVRYSDGNTTLTCEPQAGKSNQCLSQPQAYSCFAGGQTSAQSERVKLCEGDCRASTHAAVID